MSKAIRILHLDDSPFDAELIADAIRSGDCEAAIRLAPDRGEFLSALREQAFDVVICDYNIPGYDGLSALRNAREAQPDVPVIIVSGSLREEEAVRCVKAGATDYVLKERLQRLGTAVVRAVQEAEDIRRRVEAERVRYEVEHRFLRFAEQSEDIFWFMALNPERMTYLSPAFEKTWGIPVSAVYERPGAWLEYVHAADRERVENALQVFHSGKSHQFWEEFRVVRADGDVRSVVARGTLIRGDAGLAESSSGIIRDVTERKQLEEEFRQSQKMEAIGQLAGGVAHDFNNALSVILGFAELVHDQLGPEDPSQADLAEVIKAAHSAARLTRQLLAFSRKQILQPLVLDLNIVIAQAHQMLQRLVGEDVEILLRLSPDPGLITADPGQIEQVLMNLSANARDAMPDGGTLTFATASLTHDSATNGLDVGVGSFVVLTVSDTGQGMSEAVLEKLFEPFFTTKSLDKGTGLGLSTVYGIVKQSGGSIRVDSNPGQGTTFTFYFPAADSVSPASIEPVNERVAAGRPTETILVLEDQEALLQLTARTLEREGYHVLRAQRPSEAHAIAENHPAPVHLLLTDVVLPEMNGRAFAATLAQARPGIRTIYMTGYTSDRIVRLGIQNAGLAFLEKPFTPAKLLETVRRVLDSAGIVEGGQS